MGHSVIYRDNVRWCPAHVCACPVVGHTSVRVCACLLHVPCLIPRHARDVPRVTWCMRRSTPGNLSPPDARWLRRAPMAAATRIVVCLTVGEKVRP